MMQPGDNRFTFQAIAAIGQHESNWHGGSCHEWGQTAQDYGKIGWLCGLRRDNEDKDFKEVKRKKQISKDVHI